MSTQATWSAHPESNPIIELMKAQAGRQDCHKKFWQHRDLLTSMIPGITEPPAMLCPIQLINHLCNNTGHGSVESKDLFNNYCSALYNSRPPPICDWAALELAPRPIYEDREACRRSYANLTDSVSNTISFLQGTNHVQMSSTGEMLLAGRRCQEDNFDSLSHLVDRRTLLARNWSYHNVVAAIELLRDTQTNQRELLDVMTEFEAINHPDDYFDSIYDLKEDAATIFKQLPACDFSIALLVTEAYNGGTKQEMEDALFLQTSYYKWIHWQELVGQIQNTMAGAAATTCAGVAYNGEDVTMEGQIESGS